MLNVETIRKVRQAHFRDGKKIREITRELNLSRNTVRNIIRSGITDQKYERSAQPHPKLGSFIERLLELLREDSAKPVPHRRSAQILFEQLQLAEAGLPSTPPSKSRFQRPSMVALIPRFRAASVIGYPCSIINLTADSRNSCVYFFLFAIEHLLVGI